MQFESMMAANDWMRSLVELGAAQAIKELHPEMDALTQREAKSYVKGLGYSTRYLDRMLEEGLIHRKRRGKEKNSPLIYSRAEIKTAINAIRNANIVY